MVGTNLAGAHVGGAACEAYARYGLDWGIGEGLSNSAYAFPTLDANFGQLPIERLEEARDRLYQTAQANSDKEFLLTKVGCGIAGYPEKQIRSLFTDTPDNIIKPAGW